MPVAGQDPVIAISCSCLTFTGSSHGGAPADDGLASDGEEEEDGDGSAAAVATSVASVAAAPRTSRPAAPARDSQQLTVFLLQQGPGTPPEARELGNGRGAARVLAFASEGEMLLSWLAFMRATDPDVIAVFQTNESMALLKARFAALRLDGGGVYLSRMARQHSKNMEVKKTTMYSAQWVRSQSRMASTSNQETFSVGIEGRVVVDVLRQVLSGSNLGTYSLADAVQSLLGETLEVRGERRRNRDLSNEQNDADHSQGMACCAMQLSELSCACSSGPRCCGRTSWRGWLGWPVTRQAPSLRGALLLGRAAPCGWRGTRCGGCRRYRRCCTACLPSPKRSRWHGRRG